MKLKRLLWSLRLCIISNGYKRAQYAKKKGIYAGVGKNVLIQPRIVPLYSNLIKIHDNVKIAKNVNFFTHDATHAMLNKMYPDMHAQEVVGCIEIMDNVFVGGNSTILSNVRIGPNVIIAAGSVVTKDIPPNTVCAGIPARPICSFDDYVKRRCEQKYDNNLRPRNQQVSDELARQLWQEFDEEHNNK